MSCEKHHECGTSCEGVATLESKIAEHEKRAAWAEDLLQRATGHIAGKERWNEHARQWIEDYAKGPSEGNGGGG